MTLDEYTAPCPTCGNAAVWVGQDAGGENGTRYTEIRCLLCSPNEIATETMPAPIPLPARESRAPRSWDEWTAQIRARLRGESA